MSQQVLDVFEQFEPRDVDAWMFAAGAMREQLTAQIRCFPAYVLPSPGEPAAICGVLHAQGVGEVWLVTGKQFRRFSPIIVRQLHQLCLAAIEVFHLHRLHMTVDSDDAAAKRFAERLGFRCEAARLSKLGARGNDLDMYLFEKGR